MGEMVSLFLFILFLLGKNNIGSEGLQRQGQSSDIAVSVLDERHRQVIC